MKQYILISLWAALLVSCGNKNSPKTSLDYPIPNSESQPPYKSIFAPPEIKAGMHCEIVDLKIRGIVTEVKNFYVEFVYAQTNGELKQIKVPLKMLKIAPKIEE